MSAISISTPSYNVIKPEEILLINEAKEKAKELNVLLHKLRGIDGLMVRLTGGFVYPYNEINDNIPLIAVEVTKTIKL